MLPNDQRDVPCTGVDLAPILDYAAPQVVTGGRQFFRFALAVFGLLGIAANILIVAIAVSALYQARHVYHSLKQDPRAYGRWIAPEVVESLKGPHVLLWISHVTLALCAALGMVLAFELIVIAWRAQAGIELVHSRLWFYSRLKHFGAVLTAISYVWATEISFEFWSEATRHHSVGGSRSLIVGVPLLLAGLAPWWLIQRSLRSAEAGSSRPQVV